MTDKEKTNFRISLEALFDEKFGSIANMSYEDRAMVINTVKDIFAVADYKRVKKGWDVDYHFAKTHWNAVYGMVVRQVANSCEANTSDD